MIIYFLQNLRAVEYSSLDSPRQIDKSVRVYLGTGLWIQDVSTIPFRAMIGGPVRTGLRERT